MSSKFPAEFRRGLRILFVFATFVLVVAVATPEDRAAKTIEAWTSPVPGKVFVIAHRADWRQFPENSLAAIRSCIELGVDVAEIDLQRTKDGELVIMHDVTVDRTTTGRGRVDELTLAEIRGFHLRDGLGMPTPYRVPTLREALEFSGGRIVFNLDKSYRHLAQVLPLLVSLGAERHVILKGPWTVAEMQSKHGPLWRRFAYMPVVSFGRPGALDLLRDWLQHTQLCAVELVFPTWTPEVEEAFKLCQAAGIRIWVNTLWPELSGGRSDELAVECPADVYGWLIERGVSAISTDRPRELIAYLASRRTEPAK